jgi:hypothetical protein
MKSMVQKRYEASRILEVSKRIEATIKALVGECERYAMVPVHRATARDRPYYTRPGEPTHPCIVGAGLAPYKYRFFGKEG